MTKYLVFFVVLCISSLPIEAQNLTISGRIRDAQTGEELIGANVFVKEANTGTITNLYGFYSLTLPKGVYHLRISFIGYTETVEEVKLETENQVLDVGLNPSDQAIEEITVTGEKVDRNVKHVEMSTVKLQVKELKKIPALMGEVDVLRSIQLLPGVQNGGENSTGFFVRGGNIDQNLVLLDGAPVYNAAHAGGVFSVFNSDAIKDVKLYKGGIPAEYGGRLSSVLDIRMKEGNSKEFAVSGGIGVLSSRLTVEGPIIKDKCSFIVTGRRTYADLFLPLSSDTLVKEAKALFHDFNAKVNYRFNNKNRLFISGYFGRDIMRPNKDFKMSYGNITTTIRWNHLFSDKMFANYTFIYSNFDYGLGVPEGPMAFDWISNIIDFQLRNDYNWYINPKHTLTFGLQAIHHTFKPGIAKSIGDSFFNMPTLPDNHALEYAAHINNEHKISERLFMRYGLRYSVFQNIGTGTIFYFDEIYQPVDSSVYASGDVYNTYDNLEPRLSMRFTINKKSSLKASYNRTAQYIHLAINSTAGTPMDIWFPSSPNVKPQKADQVALGYFRNFRQNTVEASIEGYYKKMYNTIDFKDHAELLLNKYFEGELRFGESYSYGLELLVKKQMGELTGWISYTLSRTMRDIPEIDDEPFFAPYDKTHDIAIVAAYDYKQWNFAMNWIYTTAPPRTMPTGRFEYGGMFAPVYSERNTERVFDYHRLDLSATYYFKKKRSVKRKIFENYESSINFSVYNAYGRKNPFMIMFNQSEENPKVTEAEIVYLFRFLPSVTYNFSF